VLGFSIGLILIHAASSVIHVLTSAGRAERLLVQYYDALQVSQDKQSPHSRS
jgi:hypothetical protein